MCHNSTLKGKYGFYRTGTATAGGDHLAAAGFMVFDGMGKIEAYQNASLNGVYTADSLTTGFYHVYPECVFTLSMAPYQAIDYAHIELTHVKTVGVIVEDGKELYALATDPGRTVLFIAKKM